jgi:hypothetical protein
MIVFSRTFRAKDLVLNSYHGNCLYFCFAFRRTADFKKIINFSLFSFAGGFKLLVLEKD